MKMVYYKPFSAFVRFAFAKNSLITQEDLETKVAGFSKPTLSYALLLTASVIIATLGLLMNASAIVIGSMIISPLTWPMFGIADGASQGNQKRLWSGFTLMLASVLYAGIIAYLITVFSPLKVINSEILARSSPTLLDAIVALTAGGIGALAIVRKNISDSVAGVAVALSLTPPLCVVGIGLALGEMDIALGSFLLMITNALSITLVATIVLILAHYTWRHHLKMSPRAIGIMLTCLLLTAIPLWGLLKDYSVQASAYGAAQFQIANFAEGISASSSTQNVSTELIKTDGEDIIRVSADIFLPPGVIFTYEDKDRLLKILESDLRLPVDLVLRIQTLSVLTSANDIAERDQSQLIKTTLQELLKEYNQALSIDDISTTHGSAVWDVRAQVSGFQTSVPTEAEVKNIETKLSDKTGLKVLLSISFSPLINIKTDQQAESERIRTTITDQTLAAFPEAVIERVDITGESGSQRAVVSLGVTSAQDLDAEQLNALKQLINSSLGFNLSIQFNISRYEVYEL